MAVHMTMAHPLAPPLCCQKTFKMTTAPAPISRSYVPCTNFGAVVLGTGLKFLDLKKKSKQSRRLASVEQNGKSEKTDDVSAPNPVSLDQSTSQKTHTELKRQKST